MTVPHVRYVVGAGYVKQKAFDPIRGMESFVPLKGLEGRFLYLNVISFPNICTLLKLENNT
jgi:hypothetical protein